MSIYDRRFVLFSGKGGVGKTTLASAFAYSCARRGQKTLLVEINVKDRVSRIFGSTEIGEEIVEIEDRLYAVNATPTAAIEEYALMVLKLRIVYKAVFENRIVRSFLDVIPGLKDLVLLGKSQYHAEEVDDDGDLVWDMVVVDAPATGHGIFFLQIPSVITNVLSGGPMYEEALRMQTYLRDPETTAVNLVTLPEEMPVNETLMLRDVLRNELEVPVGFVTANSLYPPLFDGEEMEMLDAAHEASETENSPLGGFLEAALFRNQRHRMQARYLAKLREEVDVELVEIPYFFQERIDFPTMEAIADELDRQLAADESDLSSAQAAS